MREMNARRNKIKRGSSFYSNFSSHPFDEKNVGKKKFKIPLKEEKGENNKKNPLGKRAFPLSEPLQEESFLEKESPC